MHTRKGRVIAGPDARARRAERVGRQPPYGFHISGYVDPAELLVRGRFGRHAGFGPDRSQEIDAGPESARCQRMSRSEVVGG